MLAELTPDHEVHGPAPGAPTGHIDTPHIPAEEQAGIQAAHMEGRALRVGSVSGGRPDRPPEPHYSFLVLCKIFIYSPKRLRLQVVEGDQDRVSSGTTLGTSTTQPGPAVLTPPGLGGGPGLV